LKTKRQMAHKKRGGTGKVGSGTKVVICRGSVSGNSARWPTKGKKVREREGSFREVGKWERTTMREMGLGKTETGEAGGSLSAPWTPMCGGDRASKSCVAVESEGRKPGSQNTGRLEKGGSPGGGEGGVGWMGKQKVQKQYRENHSLQSCGAVKKS